MARARISLRTGDDYNASEICRRLGGGGHRAAAGATVEGGHRGGKAGHFTGHFGFRRGALMAGGILILDKPAGWTSHDAVAKLRGILKERRIGHGGTLDPMATGVLPVFVGRATRAVELFEAADKTYVAGLRLGLVTNTEDSTGEVLETRPVSVTQAQLQQALDALVGEQLQVPPMYSAIKIGGKSSMSWHAPGKRQSARQKDHHF